LGLGDWAWAPIPNPQSPIPNPQSPFNINNFENFINIWIYNTTLKFIKIQLKYKR